MGTEPYGSAVSSYGRGKRFAEWRAMLPWFVKYEGEPSNPARNVQVEISGIEWWVLSTNERRWIQVEAAFRPAWDSLYAPNAVDRIPMSAVGREANGARRYSTNPEYMHGGLGQVSVLWTDVRRDGHAAISAVHHRLVLERSDCSDQRSAADVGVQAGVDYYPFVGARLTDLEASYVPAAGVGDSYAPPQNSAIPRFSPEKPGCPPRSCSMSSRLLLLIDHSLKDQFWLWPRQVYSRRPTDRLTR